MPGDLTNLIGTMPTGPGQVYISDALRDALDARHQQILEGRTKNPPAPGFTAEDPAVDNTTEFQHFGYPTAQQGLHGSDPYTEELKVAPYVAKPLTCSDRCDEEEKLARVHCDAIRKRVQQWMKDSGCPSSIKGFKKKPKCGYRKKAAASTPAAPTASTRRGATQRRRR